MTNDGTWFPTLVFTKLVQWARLPKYMTTGAAGADLTSSENLTLYPGKTAMVSTGLSAVIPSGYEVQIRPRSGLAAKHGVTVLNAPGTIDSDYTLEWKVILINHSDEPFRIVIGDRIAQMVIAPVVQLPFAEDGPDGPVLQNSVSDTVRIGGFGSTS